MCVYINVYIYIHVYIYIYIYKFIFNEVMAFFLIPQLHGSYKLKFLEHDLLPIIVGKSALL